MKQRLDVILVDRGLADSREQAKRLILAGMVKVRNISNPKPGLTLDIDSEISVTEREKYVSRGGIKLQHAIESFAINLTGLVCADIGASTGGFTDCMIQHGATSVYAVDVGATQMHERVRNNPIVTLLENTNAKHLASEMFPVAPEFVAVDISFISILRVAKAIQSIVADGGQSVILIKPQFEAGREIVAKSKGVIKDPNTHREVLQTVLNGLQESGWQVVGLIGSPIAGGSGNIEFLCHCRKIEPSEITSTLIPIDIDFVIQSTRATVK